ncbi:TetR/AcrR family transcriptional regulator [Domibacillus sp. A3M-37]|uniref:TetR/AcrR family transcriptional regulator n=1 Tax=Domibacillus sp. A3M-37 TaxID=2962037 RepID=UPI0020B68DFC|nr:TetR/AcrR family transcriptional regulator [Domibacillus sp. A3M-37]MCP3764330.1 TetR/AcrR family transcriptional regulator [Domibacillus sp. A3M-37]
MKDRIMNAFIEEILDKSMKFTMDDLARRLGINKRTLYEHFPSKVAILDAIINSSLTAFDERTDAILADPDLTLLDKIKQTITVAPTFTEFYDLRILEQMKRHYPAQWEKMNTALNQWDDLRTLIEQAIDDCLIGETNVPLIIKLIIDATNTTLDRQFFQDNRITVQEALHSIGDIFLYGLVKKN